MSRFWKLWGSIAGGIAGLVVAGLVAGGVGHCTDATNVATCTVAGFSTAQITNGLTMLGAAVGTWLAPKNA